MMQYASLALDLIFIFYVVKKFYDVENRLEEITEFLSAQRSADEERRNDYEVDLNARLETIQRMRFSPLRVVPKRTHEE
jgi:hypothetical protein